MKKVVVLMIAVICLMASVADARYYSTATRRFLSEDPIGFNGGDVNFYAYVKNNPVSFKDPLGLTPGQPPLAPSIDPGSSDNFMPRWDGPTGAQDLPDFNISIGVGGALSFLASNGSGITGVAFDSSGTICVTFERCIGMGPTLGSGIAGSLGLAGSFGPGKLCTAKEVGSVGVTWIGGAGIAGEGQITSDGYGRGIIGIGGGIAGGVKACYTDYYCINK